MTVELDPLLLTSEERDCLLRAAREAQQKLESEMWRLTELAKGGAVNGITTTRELAATEFGCISSATRKLWKLNRPLVGRGKADDG